MEKRASNVAGRARVRRTREEWQVLIREHAQGDRSARAFCAERGIGYASFMQWRSRLKIDVDGEARPFVEITPETETDVESAPWSVELTIGEHCVLRIR